MFYVENTYQVFIPNIFMLAMLLLRQCHKFVLKIYQKSTSGNIMMLPNPSDVTHYVSHFRESKFHTTIETQTIFHHNMLYLFVFH